MTPGKGAVWSLYQRKNSCKSWSRRANAAPALNPCAFTMRTYPVLTITSFDFTQSYDWAVSLVDENFVYKKGEWIYPDRFTEDRWVESTYGIHFWMSREEAIAY